MRPATAPRCAHAAARFATLVRGRGCRTFVDGFAVLQGRARRAAVALIALLSRSRNFFIAGLAPLFPTFALIAHYIVGSKAPRDTIADDLPQYAEFPPAPG